MITKEYKDLVDKIISNTKNKKITWEQTSSEQEFKTKIGRGAVTIENRYYIDDIYNSKTHCRLTFSIINENGIQADSFSSTDEDEDLELYNLLKSLYDIAKDSYLKINETVESMLKELDSLEGGGFISLDDL